MGTKQHSNSGASASVSANANANINSTINIFLKCVFFLVIVLVSVFIFYFYFRDDIVKHYNHNDNKYYDIRNKGSLETKQKAADYLSDLSNKITYLVTYMKTNQLPNKEVSERLYERWSTCKLRETSSTDDSVAFTIYKGHEIRICIRSVGYGLGSGSGLSSGSDSTFEDNNTALFVILHELAHIMSYSYGHNEEFNQNFSYITHLASYLGIYIPEDFSTSPKTYCGTSINTTPCSEGTCYSK